jgi:hypothetical protein
MFAYTGRVPDRWCTVTVTDEQGRRHSLDVQACSTYDAAHLYVAHSKTHGGHLPIPSVATAFEVVTAGRVYRVEGAALQRWILRRREDWKGPKGFLFKQRPML